MPVSTGNSSAGGESDILASSEVEALRQLSPRLTFTTRQASGHRFGTSRILIDLLVDGVFVIGSDGTDELRRRVEALVANDLRWLTLYGLENDPLEWIDRVRAQAWTWQFPSWSEPCTGNRCAWARFSGNVAQYSAGFSYILIDSLIITEVRRLKDQVSSEQPWST